MPDRNRRRRPPLFGAGQLRHLTPFRPDRRVPRTVSPIRRVRARLGRRDRKAAPDGRPHSRDLGPHGVRAAAEKAAGAGVYYAAGG